MDMIAGAGGGASRSARGSNATGRGFGGKPLTKQQIKRARARRANAGTNKGYRQARALMRAQKAALAKVAAGRRAGNRAMVRKNLRTARALGSMISDLTGGTI